MALNDVDGRSFAGGQFRQQVCPLRLVGLEELIPLSRTPVGFEACKCLVRVVGEINKREKCVQGMLWNSLLISLLEDVNVYVGTLINLVRVVFWTAREIPESNLTGAYDENLPCLRNRGALFFRGGDASEDCLRARVGYFFS